MNGSGNDVFSVTSSLTRCGFGMHLSRYTHYAKQCIMIIRCVFRRKYVDVRIRAHASSRLYYIVWAPNIALLIWIRFDSIAFLQQCKQRKNNRSNKSRRVIITDFAGVCNMSHLNGIDDKDTCNFLFRLARPIQRMPWK